MPRCDLFANLPDLFLEDVFIRLSIQQRYYASMVCTNWNRIFYSPRVWATFQMRDRVLTRRKFNYYLGYEHILDHYRTQICLRVVGPYFRRILIRPMSNFFNLYEFLNMLSSFAEFFDENPLRFVHTFLFSFACLMKLSSFEGEKIFGTGGQLLEALKRLLVNLTGLKTLILNDLLLSEREAISLMDEIVYHCCDSIKKLRLVNYSKDLCPLLHVGMLLNLTELTISPQQLSDDLVIVLAHTPIKHLYLVQNPYTEIGISVPASAWQECKKLTRLSVHLRVEGSFRKEIIWQEKAPVKSVIYESPYVQISTESILRVVDLYGTQLETYGHLSIPKFFMSRSFHNRADSALVLLCRQCPMLTTLIIRQLISTATVLLLAWSGKNLKRLYIRRNAMIKKSDWPRSPDWSEEFYFWLCENSRSYELVEKEVSRLLRLPWHPLNDFHFKELKIDVTSR